jgi:hypothetical protein
MGGAVDAGSGFGASRWLWMALVIPNWPATIPEPLFPISQGQILALLEVSSLLRLLTADHPCPFLHGPLSRANCETRRRDECTRIPLFSASTTR